MTEERKTLFECMSSRIEALTPSDRERMHRVMTGEDNDDLLRREDVRVLIRGLRTDPVPSIDYQKALGDVQRLVTNLPAVSVDVEPEVKDSGVFVARYAFSRRHGDEPHPDVLLNRVLSESPHETISVQQTRIEYAQRGAPDTYTVLVEYLVTFKHQS